MSNPSLTPRAGGGLCISDAALKPADIIVSTTGGFDSGVIRAGTYSKVSHALLYADSGEIIEAVGEGVHRTTLAAVVPHDTLAVAYRYKGGLPAEAAAKIIDYADAQARRGAGYDYLGALGAGANSNPSVCVIAFGITCPAVAGGVLNNQDKFFCSELVLEAYRRAGYPVTKMPSGVASPERIVQAYSHGVLEYIGHLVTD